MKIPYVESIADLAALLESWPECDPASFRPFAQHQIMASASGSARALHARLLPLTRAACWDAEAGHYLYRDEAANLALYLREAGNGILVTASVISEHQAYLQYHTPPVD